MISRKMSKKSRKMLYKNTNQFQTVSAESLAGLVGLIFCGKKEIMNEYQFIKFHRLFLVKRKTVW